MKNINSIFVTGVLAASLVGCVTTPPVEEMSQLDGQQVKDLVFGNTWVTKHDWGRWAEYHKDDMTGNAKASGSWGQELVTSVYTVSEDGEICSVYEGEAEWAGPEHEYCGVVFMDESGAHFAKNTKNTSKPERVGRVKKLEIKPGDHYELSEE